MQKIARIAIVGAPNVGKSTLINAIVGEKVSITTFKPQTTRDCVRGILNVDETQLVFIDTPGLFAANIDNASLKNIIILNAFNGLRRSNVLLFLFDATKIMDERVFQKYAEIWQKVKEACGGSKICVGCLNKIDLLEESSLPERIIKMRQIENFDAVFTISAHHVSGIQELIKFFVDNAYTHEWAYDADAYTDASEKKIAEELTREQVYLHLKQELPYSINVITDRWIERSTVTIFQSILVLKNSQKKIVLGQGGTMIKKIGILAREQICKQLGRPIRLFLYVKVRGDWIDRMYSAVKRERKI